MNERGQTEGEEVERCSRHDLIGSKDNREQAEQERDHCCSNDAAHHATCHRGTERRGEQHSFDAEIDHAAALDEELTFHGEQQRDSGDDRQRHRGAENLKHRLWSSVARSLLLRRLRE